jgi:hypothetical protein
MGDLLATEHVNSHTEFTVPLMRGNDLHGLNYKSTPVA